MLQVNYPFPLTDLQQNQQTFNPLQFRDACKKKMCIRDRRECVCVTLRQPVSDTIDWLLLADTSSRDTMLLPLCSWQLSPLYVLPSLAIYYTEVGSKESLFWVTESIKYFELSQKEAYAQAKDVIQQVLTFSNQTLQKISPYLFHIKLCKRQIWYYD